MEVNIVVGWLVCNTSQFTQFTKLSLWEPLCKQISKHVTSGTIKYVD